MIPYKSMNDFLEQQAEKFKDKTALIYAEDNSKVSYAELNERANKVANFLKEAGVKKGDRVSTLVGGCLEFVYLLFGTLKRGAILNPINPTLVAKEIKFRLEDSAPAAVFVNEENFKKIKETDLKIKNLFAFGVKSNEIKDFETSMEDSSSEFVDEQNISLENDAFLLYSSGTTGNPKGIVLTQKNVFEDAFSVRRALKLTSNDIALGCMPLFFSGGLMLAFFPLLCIGGTMVMQKKFSKSKFWMRAEKYKVTWTPLVPTMVSILLNPPEDISKMDLSSLRIVSCGAAPLPIELLKKFEKTFKKPLFDGYGLTENTAITSFMRPAVSKRKIGSVGTALDIAKIKIFDENGKEIPPGKVGEIVIKGPHVMRHYWKRPKETEETLKGGWLHTGDLGYVDKDGYLYIRGRKKDLIIKGGENISPRQVDEVLYQHPAVADAATVGVPDKMYGEEIKAFVVLKKGEKATESELIEHCKKHLGEPKCPKSVKFIKEIPKTGSGKILRRKLVES